MQKSLIRRVVTLGLVGAVLSVSAAAMAQDDLKKQVADLQKKVADLEMKSSPASARDVQADVIRKTVTEMSSDAAKNSGDFRVVWKNGVWMKSTDDQFAFHVGGRLYSDWSWFRAPSMERHRPNMGQGDPADLSALQFRDGEEFRAVRLMAEGTMYKYVDFKVEMDFSDGETVLRDAYIELTQLPYVGNVRVGNFKEPFGLEEQTDSLFGTFMERSMGNAFVPGRNPGMMAHNAILGEKGSERMTWAVGVFRHEFLGNGTPADSDDLEDVRDWADGWTVRSEGGYAITGRITGLPWYEAKGERLLHVGLAYSYAKQNDSVDTGAGNTGGVRYMARPSNHMIQYPLLDVTVANAEAVNLLGAETALVYGPFSAQSEFTTSIIDRNSTPGLAADSTSYATDPTCFNAWYGQVSYFITGEHRQYNTATGAFDRVKPKKNFREDGGWGAFEVASRIDYISMDQGGLQTFTTVGDDGSRGQVTAGTLGVNWYLNPNTRIMANWVHACVDRPDVTDGMDILMMRFQIDF